MTAKAACTWGVAADVTITIDWVGSDGFPLDRHRNGEWTMGLSQGEARALARELISAADDARAHDLDFEWEGEGRDH
jgi:hypothetical protein